MTACEQMASLQGEDFQCFNGGKYTFESVMFIIQCIVCYSGFFLTKKNKANQIWRWFLIVYAGTTTTVFLTTCYNRKGKYVAIMNCTPQKYQIPYVFLGVFNIWQNILKSFLLYQMHLKQAEKFSIFKAAQDPYFMPYIIFCIIHIFFPGDQIYYYTYTKYLSFALAAGCICGYRQKSAYSNIGLILYSCCYIGNLEMMWLFFSKKETVMILLGESINLMNCIFLVYGTSQLSDDGPKAKGSSKS
mmetsp:Transcript_32129/g.23731  ORF Transcript_32129/g.23731 Transcript_32129/m.23731 type:complete len:245 (+) Transcript_32129:36-770(+)